MKRTIRKSSKKPRSKKPRSKKTRNKNSRNKNSRKLKSKAIKRYSKKMLGGQVISKIHVSKYNEQDNTFIAYNIDLIIKIYNIQISDKNYNSVNYYKISIPFAINISESEPEPESEPKVEEPKPKVEESEPKVKESESTINARFTYLKPKTQDNNSIYAYSDTDEKDEKDKKHVIEVTETNKTDPAISNKLFSKDFIDKIDIKFKSDEKKSIIRQIYSKINEDEIIISSIKLSVDCFKHQQHKQPE